jgi:hypothetical protein
MRSLHRSDPFGYESYFLNIEGLGNSELDYSGKPKLRHKSLGQLLLGSPTICF